jgi:hypothetical protein
VGRFRPTGNAEETAEKEELEGESFHTELNFWTKPGDLNDRDQT